MKQRLHLLALSTKTSNQTTNHKGPSGPFFSEGGTQVLIAGLDFESGGSFDRPLTENFITEIGCVLWDCDVNQPVRMMNVLVNQDLEIFPEAEEYTGISTGMVKKYGAPLKGTLEGLLKMVAQADYIVAQNGLMFDRPLLKQELEKEGMGHLNPRHLWLDTTCDVPYPKNCRNTNLTYLAGFHLILNCFPHRAVTDVLTMLTVLSKYDLPTVIKNASEPVLTVRAMTKFEQKDLAKKAGFYWKPDPDNDELGNPIKYPPGYKKSGMWLKNFRKSAYEEVKASWTFEHKVLKEEVREGAIRESDERQY